jgi:glycerol-3-phosphate dehydrogenase
MRVYDLLAGKYGFGKSRVLSVPEVLGHIPTLEREGLRGGVLYYDGQFDDARLLIDLTLTAEAQGAALVNYARVESLSHDAQGYGDGVTFVDGETGAAHRVGARCVINATGAFCDAVRRMDEPGARGMIAPSQGVHVVLDRSFLPGDAAIMVPHTSDGRVLFAIPWHGHALLGTRDTPVDEAALEPVAQEGEIEFILSTAAHYLARRPGRGDVRSVFAGIRPLVRGGERAVTAALSREHVIHVSQGGLLTIAGGKWTTYRKMAEDCVDHAATLARLEERPCVTRELRIHGYHERAQEEGDLWFYGAAAGEVRALLEAEPALGRRLHEALPIVGAQVIHAARVEMARTVEDVLARRTRALFLDARAALAMAEDVARLLAAELGRDAAWERAQVAAFADVAKGYLPG